MPETNKGLPADAEKATSLYEAVRDYRDQKLFKEYCYVDDDLKKRGKWEYIGDFEDNNFVPSETDGLTQHLLEQRRAIAIKMEMAFIGLLSCGKLTAWAREKSPLAPWQEVPASAWATMRLKNISKGIVEGPGFFLYDVRVGPRVNLPAQQTARPVTSPAPASQPLSEQPQEVSPSVPVRKPPKATTGAPGRPTSMHLVVNEFKRRCEDGLFDGNNFKRESEHLAEWFVEHYKEEQPIQPHSIRNSISKAWRKFPDEIRNKCIKF